MDEITVCGQSLSQQSIHPHSFLNEWLLCIFAASVAAAYIFALLVVRKQKRDWNPLNVIAFFVGIGMVLVAYSPPMMVLGHESIKIHMVQHILAAMFAPIFLVLGRPLTLTLKAISPHLARKLMAILRSRVVLFFSHPLVAFLLNIGGMFVLYLTNVYAYALNNPAVHFVIHIHFLLAGYLFTWSIIRIDPIPVRPSFKMEVAVVFLTIACHAFLSKYMYAFNFPLAMDESVLELQEAAKLMYYWGDFSELVLLVILFSIFSPYRSKFSRSIALPMKLLPNHIL